MFNPFRSLLVLHLETTLQMLDLSKKLLDIYLSALPQPTKMTSTMLALVPVKVEQGQHLSRALIRPGDRA